MRKVAIGFFSILIVLYSLQAPFAARANRIRRVATPQPWNPSSLYSRAVPPAQSFYGHTTPYYHSMVSPYGTIPNTIAPPPSMPPYYRPRMPYSGIPPFMGPLLTQKDDKEEQEDQQTPPVTQLLIKDVPKDYSAKRERLHVPLPIKQPLLGRLPAATQKQFLIERPPSSQPVADYSDSGQLLIEGPLSSQPVADYSDSGQLLIEGPLSSQSLTPSFLPQQPRYQKTQPSFHKEDGVDSQTDSDEDEEEIDLLDPKLNYYEVLGIPRSATAREVKLAYNKQAVKYHPDRNPGKDAAAITRRIIDAYEMLRDPESRKRYDARLFSRERSTRTPFYERGYSTARPTQQASGTRTSFRKDEEEKDLLDPKLNLYEVLSIPYNAAAQEVILSHRRLSLKYHPDRNFGKDTTKIIQRINHARDILTDPEKRKQYDEELFSKTKSTKSPYGEYEHETAAHPDRSFFKETAPAASILTAAIAASTLFGTLAKKSAQDKKRKKRDKNVSTPVTQSLMHYWNSLSPEQQHTYMQRGLLAITLGAMAQGLYGKRDELYNWWYGNQPQEDVQEPIGAGEQ